MSQNCSKIAPGWLPKWLPNRSEIDPEASWRDLGAVLAAWKPLGGLLERPWSPQKCRVCQHSAARALRSTCICQHALPAKRVRVRYAAYASLPRTGLAHLTRVCLFCSADSQRKLISEMPRALRRLFDAAGFAGTGAPVRQGPNGLRSLKSLAGYTSSILAK